MDTASMAEKADTDQISRTAGTDGGGVRTIGVRNNRIESRDLFVTTREITIGHEGEVYRLRLTALNKLILTK